MRRRPAGIQVWPAFSDLMSGVAVLLVLWVSLLNKEKLGLRQDVARSKMEVAELANKNRQLEAQLTTLNDRLKELEDRNAALHKELIGLRAQRRTPRPTVALPVVTPAPSPAPVAASPGAAAEIGGMELQLVERLSQELHKEQVTAVIDRGTGAVDLQEELLPQLNRPDLPEEDERTAAKIGHAVVRVLEDRALAKNIARIEVVGHADGVGGADLNLRLSRQRATALVDLWRREIDLRPDSRCILAKIFPVGISNFRPRILDESDDQACGDVPDDPSTRENENRGCRMNRRIEIRIVPKDEHRTEVVGCP